MTREEAVQKTRERAREWYVEHQLEFYSLFDAMAAYALDRLAAELGELAKEMCHWCKQGKPLIESAYEHYLPDDSPNLYRDMEQVQTRPCSAAPIRRRLAAIEQVRKEK